MRLSTALLIGTSVLAIAAPAMAQDVVDRTGMVRHVEPVALLQAVAVERQGLIVDRIRHE